MGVNVGEPLLLEWQQILQGKFPGKGNHDQMPGFNSQSIRGKATSAGFDSISFCTTVVLQTLLERTDHLAGCAMRLGEKWGVIKTVEGNRVLCGEI